MCSLIYLKEMSCNIITGELPAICYEKPRKLPSRHKADRSLAAALAAHGRGSAVGTRARRALPALPHSPSHRTPSRRVAVHAPLYSYINHHHLLLKTLYKSQGRWNLHTFSRRIYHFTLIPIITWHALIIDTVFLFWITTSQYQFSIFSPAGVIQYKFNLSLSHVLKSENKLRMGREECTKLSIRRRYYLT